jgi:hypothetical protein
MTPPRSILIAIAEAVEQQGGDIEDVHDLVAAWERLRADKHGHAARLHYDAAHPICHCADGGKPDQDARCERCHGCPGVKHGASR